jgi:hypothetical protein
VAAIAGADQERGSVLWVGKTPVNGGGDEIYDRRLTEHLARIFAIERLQVAGQSRLARLAALARGVPHPRYKHASNALNAAFRAGAARNDHLVISWEALESLAWKTERPLTLILHNVTSDYIAALYGNHPLLRFAAPLSRRWEKRTYRRANLRLVVLSQHDHDLVKALAPEARILIAPPGTPPLVRLEQETLLREVVISGSYDWAPKRRDLLALAAEIGSAEIGNDQTGQAGVIAGWRHDLEFPDVAGAAPLRRASRLITAADYAAGLRFGVVPDTFVGGFKLKSTSYIASNCVLLSRCDIRREFAGLPHHADFVHYTPHFSDIVRVIERTAAAEGPALYERWREFQSACAARFSWQRSAEVIAESIGG